MPLSLKQIQDVCLLGQGAAQCRFLGEDVDKKYYCLKLNQSSKSEINEEVDGNFIKPQRAKGVDPTTAGVPIGNNCSGYRILKVKMQGYDLDGKTP